MSDVKKSKKQRVNKRANFGKYYLPTILIVGLVLILFMIKDNPTMGPSTDLPLEEFLIKTVGYLAVACEIFGAIVIGLAAVVAIVSYIKHFFDKSYTNQIRSSERVRLRLGHQLSLGLEFAVAADILRLVISPNFGDLIVLFAIILLRVLLNVFLEHDIDTITESHILPEAEELNCAKDEDDEEYDEED